MKKSFLLLALTAILLPVFSSAHETPDKVTIHMTKSGFEPRNVSLTQGQTILFENSDNVLRWPASNIHPTHEIYSEFDPKKGIPAGESWSFTFTKSGVWKMHDHIFPQLAGTITVQKSDAVAPAEAPDAIAPKKGFWKKIWGFITSLFSSKKNAEQTLQSPAPQNNGLQATVTTELKQQAKGYETISKDSKEIWNNDAALLAYMKKYGATQTFAQLDAMEKQDVGDCHQTAHRAGHFGLALFGNEVLKECNLSCHSGCYHGATEEYFKINGSDNLSEGLNSLCAASAGNPFYNHQCLHGLGHGLMAWNSYDLPEALTTCDLLTTGQGSCWTGVFMENIVAGLATDKGDTHITAYKNDDPQYPCTIVDEKYKGSCYFLQTSRMMQMFGVDFKKIADACALAPELYRSSCFQSMGRDVSSAYRPTPARSIQECGHAPERYRIDCLNGAVQDALWDMSGQNTAITFCTLLTKSPEKVSCYNTIIGRMREIAKNDAEKQAFCSAVEKDYKYLCF